MEIKRLWHTCRLALQRGGFRRAEYCRKNHLFHAIGKGCSLQIRKLPLYANLITIHNNVHVASRVHFLTHDVTHRMINASRKQGDRVQERLGCIEIMDNVFIGAGTTIMYNVRIGSNVIVGAESVVTKDLEPDSVYAGAPARRICSMDEYMEKRLQSADYPSELIPRHQKASPELEAYLWRAFEEKRSAAK